MSSPPKRYRPARVLLWVALSLVLLGSGIYLYFVYNAHTFIERLVHNKSEGTLEFNAQLLWFNPFTNTMTVRNATLGSTDTLNRDVAYHISFRSLTVQVPSLLPLLLRGQLMVDSVKLFDPVVDVTLLRRDTTRTSDLSLTQEMGNVYNFIVQGLDDFGVGRVVIDNAGMRLTDRTRPGRVPTEVSRIRLDLSQNKNPGAEFPRSVSLNIQEQNITLPDGRHRIAFDRFNLQLFRQLITLDNCTVTAIPTDTTNSAFTLFFDQLALVGVDFDAMYRYNLVRADTVYCEHPEFDLAVYRTDTARNREMPDPSSMIRDITSDMELGFVAIKQAAIRADLRGPRRQLQFASNTDNFEIHNLRIRADSSAPVTASHFRMRARDYTLFNSDSTTAYAFDSIHFVDDRITLYNFTVATTTSPTVIRSDRDFHIPFFELTGLDWYGLVFEQNVQAREALLQSPTINYTRRGHVPNNRNQNRALLATVQTLDSLVTLDRLTIRDGELTVRTGADTWFRFNDVNVDLYTHDMLTLDGATDLNTVVRRLSFRDGRLGFGGYVMQFDGVRSPDNGLLHAERVTMFNESDSTKAWASGVFIGNVIFDDETETVQVQRVQWENASMSSADMEALAAPNANRTKRQADGHGTTIILTDVNAGRTALDLAINESRVTTTVSKLEAARIERRGESFFEVTNLLTRGRDLHIRNSNMEARAVSYQVSSAGTSSLDSVSFYHQGERDTLTASAPRVRFSGDLNAVFNRRLHFETLQAETPTVTLSVRQNDGLKHNDSAEAIPDPALPLRIRQLSATQPEFHMAIHDGDTALAVHLPRSPNGFVRMTNLRQSKDGFGFESLGVRTAHASFATPDARYKMTDGLLDLRLTNASYAGPDDWRFTLDTLHVEHPDEVALENSVAMLAFERLSLGNVRIEPKLLRDLNSLVRNNVEAWVERTTGTYKDTSTVFKWYNAGYRYADRSLRVDSLVYHPLKPRDEYVASKPFEIDYITLNTGPIVLYGFNAERYHRDSALVATAVTVSHPVVTVFRDKQPPFQAGIIKPLPVDMIKRFPFPMSLQRVSYSGGTIAYTERHARTRKEGTLTLTQAHGSFANLRNRDLREHDSLFLSMNALLMDTVPCRIRVSQSYTDSLSSFRLVQHIDPMPLSVLNPALAPLANAVIISGTLDSFRMRAIGREYIALGETRMLYSDLRIRLISDGDPNKRSGPFLGFASWVINTFVIDRHNRDRTGMAYFERIRDRSFFNYIVKMTFSGMATSVGFRKNKKYLRQYERKMQQQQLPPIDFELTDPILELLSPNAQSK